MGGESAEEIKRKGGPGKGQEEEEEDVVERGRKSAFQTALIQSADISKHQNLTWHFL